MIAIYAARGTNNRIIVTKLIVGEKGSTVHYTDKGENFKKGLNKFKKCFYHLSGERL